MSTQKNPYPIRSFVDPNTGIEYRGNLFDLGEALIAAYGIRTALSYNPEPWIQVDEDGHDRPTHITLNQWADWATNVLDRPHHDVLLGFASDLDEPSRAQSLDQYGRSIALNRLRTQGQVLLAVEWIGPWGSIDIVATDKERALYGYRVTSMTGSKDSRPNPQLVSRAPAAMNLQAFARKHDLTPTALHVGFVNVLIPPLSAAVVTVSPNQYAGPAQGGLGI